MADANKKTVTTEEFDEKVGYLQGNIDSNYYSITQHTKSIEALQNQMDKLSVLESGSTKNYYISSMPSTILTNKGTLSYKLYKIGNLCYVSFSHLEGANNSIGSGVTLYSEYITPQLNWGPISVSETFNNTTYTIECVYLDGSKKYKYRISIKTTLMETKMPDIYLTKIYLLT